MLKHGIMKSIQVHRRAEWLHIVSSGRGTCLWGG